MAIGDDAHCNPVATYGRCGRDPNRFQVQIGPNCAFYPYDHGMAAGGPIHEQPITSKGGIDIAADAWLGFGVVVLAGVSIGAGAVGAGSVVTKDILPGRLPQGRRRVIRMRS